MMMMMRSERVASNARSLVSHFGPGVSAPALNIKPPPPSLANNLRPAVLVKMQTSFSFYGRKWRRKKKKGNEAKQRRRADELRDFYVCVDNGSR